MKILHTSDWHIGRTFHGVDLLADQEAVLEAIAETVRVHDVDVVVVPGDIYDRSIPNSDAVLLCNRVFERIRQAGATIVATSGNHDSAARLGVGAAFTAAGGLHLKTRIPELDVPVVIRDAYGEVVFYGLPYLEPETARAAVGRPDARTHTDVLTAAMDRVRADLSARPARTRSVVLAHAFVTGAAATGSERSISAGGVEDVSADVFSGVDYVALGHLHSPQTVADHVRYSGSPLPYSFGERSHRKAVWLIDMDGDGVTDVERVDLPVVRGLSQITGDLEDLLHDPAHASIEGDYISAVLTDERRPIDAMRKLQSRFPFAVHLEWRAPEGRSALHYGERVRGRTDLEIATRFVSDVRDAPGEREMQWIESALAKAGAKEAGAR